MRSCVEALPRAFRLLLLLYLLLLCCCSSLVRAKPKEIKPGCRYDGHRYLESEYVATAEPCLQCLCVDGSLRCRLRICPRLPPSTPPGCRVRPPAEKACCSELVCGPDDEDDFSDEDENENILQPSRPVNSPSSRTDEGCVYEGVRYGPGSAMMGSRRCEYCYCISGNRRCIRPKCLLPLPGCAPLYAPHSCCPVAYNCTRQTSELSTTHVAISANGCRTGQRVYQEGEMVRDIAWKAACDNCFCAMGFIRCVPLACAPPLQGCKPIVREGQCCPSTYNCSGTIQVKATQNYASYAFISKDYAKFRKETNFYPAIQEVEALQGSVEGRGHRVVNDVLEAGVVPEVITEKFTAATVTESILTPETETMNNEILGETTDYPRHTTHDQEQLTSSITELSSGSSGSSDSGGPDQSTMSMSEAATTTATSAPRDVVSTTEVTVAAASEEEEEEVEGDGGGGEEGGGAEDAPTEIPTTTIQSTSNEEEDVTTAATTVVPVAVVVVTTTAEPFETTGPIRVLSRKNCSLGHETKSTSGTKLPAESTSSINLEAPTISATPRPEPFPNSTSVIAAASQPPQVKKAESSQTSGTTSSKTTTSENIEPKNKPEELSVVLVPDDTMVMNVTVKTNVAVGNIHGVTINPPTKSRLPGIEDMLNITNRRKATAGEDYEYDYSEPTLPPSLPNVRIIPFVAADALVKDKDDEDGVPAAVTGYPTSAVAVPPPDLSPKKASNFYDIVTQENRFNPPKKTEGGFVPKESPYFDSLFRPPNLSLEIGTGVTVAPDPLTVENPHRKSDELLSNCLYEEHEYGHGEILPNRALCKICICYYGEIVCSDRKCPPPQIGCKRVKDPSDKCCSKIVCVKGEESPTVVLDRLDSTLAVRPDPTVSPNPFRDVIKTEPAPDLPSLIGDMMIHVDQPHQPTITSSSSSSSVFTTPSIMTTTIEKPKSALPTLATNASTTTVQPTEVSSPEDESIFSLDSVFDLFFSDSSSTTSEPTTLEETNFSSTEIQQTSTSTSTTPTTSSSFTTASTTPRTTTTTTTTPLPPPQPPPPTTTTTTTKKRTTMSSPSARDPAGGTLLKLAGCNIYGRMYQVGKIITELSSQCLECTCTEFGVQCKARAC